MAAISALVLADGQATPVNKTFTPQDCTSALATWTDRSSGIGLGMPSVTLALVQSKDTNKVTGKVSIPVMEVISGSDAGYTPAPRVAYTSIGKFELVLPNRGTLQNRKDVSAFLKNFLSNAAVTKAVEEFERPF